MPFVFLLVGEESVCISKAVVLVATVCISIRVFKWHSWIGASLSWILIFLLQLYTCHVYQHCI